MKKVLTVLGCLLVTGGLHTEGGLISNGDFSQWAGAVPEGWSYSGNLTLTQENDFTFNASQALKVVIEQSASGSEGGANKDRGAVLFQDVELQPESSYTLEFSMAKHGTGSVAVRVRPLVNGRPTSRSVAPLNWSNIWSWRFPWAKKRLIFTTGKEAAYRVSFANYGKEGEPFWLEGVSLVANEKVPSEGGFSLYSDSIMRQFLEEGEAPSQGVLTRVQSFCTAGDFSPEFVGLRAERPLRAVDLRLKGPLLGEGGVTIPAENVVIRSVGEQALLPLSKPRFVPAGKNAGWWVTVRVPEEAPPGEYRGVLEVHEGRGMAKEIPYSVRVEAFRLPRPNIPMFVYHAEVYFPGGDFLSREARLAYYRDMKDHGMNTVTVYANPDQNGRTIDFSRDHRYAALTAEKQGEMLTRNNLTAKDLDERQQYGLASNMELLLESGLVTKGSVVPWLPLKAGAYSFGDMPSEALKSSVADWLARSEWPKPMLYVLDEPFGQPDRIRAAERALARIKALDLPIKTMTANIPVEELGAQYDVWVQGGRRVTPEMARDAQQLGKELWAYNCNMPTDNAPFTRAFFGFWAYRSQVKGVALWAYYSAKGWFIDEKGVIQGKDGPGQLSRICPSPDGPVPTISWETTREGVNDYRYALLFQETRAELKATAERLKGEVAAIVPPVEVQAWEESASKAQRREGVVSKWSDVDRALWLPKLTQWERLQKLVTLGEVVEDKIILSVPFDALAPMGEIPWSSENGRFIPVMGFGDQEVTAEEKRNTLRSYIRLFKAELRKLEEERALAVTQG